MATNLRDEVHVDDNFENGRRSVRVHTQGRHRSKNAIVICLLPALQCSPDLV